MAGIVILSPGRSGSSLVAGIFAEHGVWTGDCLAPNKWNPRGYFENALIKNELLRRYGRPFLGPVPEPNKEFERKVRHIQSNQGYTDGPWLFKTGAVFHKLFEPFKPTFIKVWRDKNSILASYQRCRFLSRYSNEEIEQIIDFQQSIMTEIPGPNIFTKEMVLGNHFGIFNALKEAGLKPNGPKIKKFIDPEAFSEAH